MSWTNRKGFNFRNDPILVVDGTNEIACNITTQTYPLSKTVDGDTFNIGTESTSGSLGAIDRTTSVDSRLCGVDYQFGGADADFRIDLPAAGNYAVRLALGDWAAAQTQNFSLVDGSSVLIDVPNVATGINQYLDATGTLRTSDTDWVSNNAEALVTFATTICRLRLKFPSGGSTTIAHFAIRQVAGGGGGTPFPFQGQPVGFLSQGR